MTVFLARSEEGTALLSSIEAAVDAIPSTDDDIVRRKSTVRQLIRTIKNDSMVTGTEAHTLREALCGIQDILGQQAHTHASTLFELANAPQAVVSVSRLQEKLSLIRSKVEAVAGHYRTKTTDDILEALNNAEKDHAISYPEAKEIYLLTQTLQQACTQTADHNLAKDAYKAASDVYAALGVMVSA